MRFSSTIIAASALFAALAGCGQPLRVLTRSSVDIEHPLEAQITAKVAPASDEGPVMPIVVAGPRDNCSAHIALIEVDGLLVNSNIAGPYVSGDNPVAVFHERLSAAERDPRVSGVVLRINSPGGGVVASQMMRYELDTFRQRTGVPVVACLMDVGAGGAYYLATSADTIYAQPGTVTGGIGVIFNAYSLQDTMAQLNIIGQAVKAGDNIDLGSPVRGLNENSRKILQQMANDYHQQFKDTVLGARPNVKPADNTIFDGRVLTAKQALDSGLIDKIGSLDEAIGATCRMSQQRQTAVVMYERKNHPAYSMYSTANHLPLQAAIPLPSIPGLDRAHMPAFLYMWQPEPTLERLGGI
ncbi:MAG: signal peptide peptidase SppA [Pirellulales bacterium]